MMASTWGKSSHSTHNGSCVEARWRKSTASAGSGECVEVAGNCRKSSHSMSNGQCAEVSQEGAVVQVRDSKDPEGPVLSFSPKTWSRFLAAYS